MNNVDLNSVKIVSEATNCKDEMIIKNWLKITNNDINRTIEVIKKMRQFVKPSNEVNSDSVSDGVSDNRNEEPLVIHEDDETDEVDVTGNDMTKMFNLYITELRGIREAVTRLANSVEKYAKN